jgi:hypothetical protein
LLCGALAAISVLGLGPVAAPAKTIDKRPRPVIYFARSGRFVAQDAWNSLALYRGADGALLRRFPAEHRINKFGAMADEARLLVGCEDGGVGVYDIATGDPVWRKEPSETGLGYIYGVAFARDGRSCIVCNVRDFALIFDSATGLQTGRVTFPPRETNIMSAALTPDGSRGALVDLGEQLWTFDVATGVPRPTGLTAGWPVRCSSDGRYVACRSNNSGEDEKLRVVPLDGRPVAKDVGQFLNIGNIRPTDDGGFLATALAGERYGDQWVVGGRYRPASGRWEELWKLPAGHEANECMDFDPASRTGVATNYLLATHLLDLRTGAVRLTIDNRANYREDVVTYTSLDLAPWWLHPRVIRRGLLAGAVVVVAVLGLVLAKALRGWGGRTGTGP